MEANYEGIIFHLHDSKLLILEREQGDCMEKVLITGATGLIGNGLLSLLTNEYECWVVGRHAPLMKKIHFIEQDLGRPLELSNFPKKIDYIIHLAQSDAHNDWENNREKIFNVNVYGMLQLLEYGVKAKIKKFLFASSGGVYGQLNKMLSEDEMLMVNGTLNFYQNTKLSMEILAGNYQKYYDIVTFRFFFVYGTGQKANMLFPRLIANIKEKNPVCIGALNDIKMTPIYKTDAAQCVYKALRDIQGTHIFNIAGNEVVALGDIVRKIAQKMGTDVEVQYEDKGQQGMIADTRKMQRLLWVPQVTLDEGIEKLLLG